MISARVSGLIRGLGLLLSGVLVLALPLGIVAVAALQEQPDATVVEVEAQSVGSGATTWVCAPAPMLPTAAAGADLDYDPDLGTGGGQVSTLAEIAALGAGEAPTMITGPIGEAGTEAGTSGDLAAASVPDVADPLVGVVNPTSGGVPVVGGLSVARTDAGDLRGLSVAPCQQPVTSAMIVAGSTELGSSARLVLSNPGDTAATVALTGWGATGPLPEIAPVVVPAGAVRALLLETISLEPRLAVRIEVSGGRVVPTIQDSGLDGLIPAGTETVGITADPTTTLLVAGASVADSADATAALRLVNPGDETAVVTVEMLGPEGASVLEGAEESVIEAGTVADISLAGLPAGQYGVRVTSDVPVTGAVWLARTGTAGEDDPDTPPVDVAWLPASAPADRGVLPIPTTLVDAAALSVTNPGESASEVGVTGYDATGQVVVEESLTVAAGATVGLSAPGDAVALVLEGDAFLASAVASGDAADGELISAYPIVADPYTVQSVSVRIRG